MVAACLLTLPAFPQTGSLRGQVTDESGAVVPGARITLRGAGGFWRETTSRGDGYYSFTGLPSGTYTVQAFAPALKVREPVTISLREGSQSLNLLLHVTAENRK